MRNILITGANRGIGLGFVRHYLAAGERVFATSRKVDGAYRLESLQTQFPDHLVMLELDVTREDSLQQMRTHLEHYTQSFDILMNNAGVLFSSECFAEVSADALRQSFEVNTIAPIMVIRQLLGLLEAGRSPRIVNITMPTQAISQLDRTSNHSYTASRYGLNALTKMTALELVSKGIITVGLYPGYLQTDMNQHDKKAAPVQQGIPPAAAVIDRLTLEDNGKCFLPSGSRFDW